MISIATYNEEKGYKSADGKCIWNVFNYGILSKAVEDLFYNNYEYISDGYNPSVEYVEVDGEQWYELTFDIDAFINKVGGKDYFEENFTKYNYREEDKDGDGLNDYDTMKYDDNGKFIVLVSTDFTKLKYKDVTSVSNVILMKNIVLSAERNNIKTQNQTTNDGEAVAGSVNIASYGAVTATVGIACRYSHTPVSYMRKDDIEAVSDICRVFVKESDVIIDGFIKETDRA